MNKGKITPLHIVVTVFIVGILILIVAGAIKREEMIVNECSNLGLSQTQCAAVRGSYQPEVTIDCLHEGNSIREYYVEHPPEIYD